MEKEPLLHKSHFSRPSIAPKLPGAHSVSLFDPVGQKVPARQLEQSWGLVITGRNGLVRRPAGHGSGAEDPSVQ
eukprot:3225495-Rhodomonas_salina.4